MVLAGGGDPPPSPPPPGPAKPRGGGEGAVAHPHLRAGGPAVDDRALGRSVGRCYGWLSPRFILWCLCAIELDSHRCAHFGLGLSLDRASHRLDQLQREREPETGALDVGALGAKAVEGIEQSLELIGRNPAARVRDC